MSALYRARQVVDAFAVAGVVAAGVVIAVTLATPVVERVVALIVDWLL